MRRNIIIIALFISVVTVAHGQDVNTCRPKAERILTAAHNHTPDGIDELLAADFRYTNIKQPVAAKVLKQIIAQMPAMMSWELTDTKQDSTGLTLRYTITKPDSTTSEATILFNADNLVLEADLLNADISLRKATPTAKAQPEVSVVRIPLHRYGGLPIVTVTIDGQPCNMFFRLRSPGCHSQQQVFRAQHRRPSDGKRRTWRSRYGDC